MALNANDWDGINNKFDWNNAANSNITQEELTLLREQSAKAFDLLTKIRNAATELVDVLDTTGSYINTVIANGYDHTTLLPPFPLPGTLAPLPLSSLNPGLYIFGALQQFLNTPLTTSAGQTVIPSTIIRQISN